MAEIRAYQTHIEIFPYNIGECQTLENMLSKYDAVTHKRIPIGYYIDNDILYVPRGISLTLLQNYFKSIPVVINSCDYFNKISDCEMKVEPRNRIQKEAIDFLVSENNFKQGNFCSQFGLNLDTGDGKTFSMINAILKLKMKSIIITHKSRLKEQWHDEFIKMTTIDENKIYNIENSSCIEKIMNSQSLGYDIYLVNHQTILSYAKSHSWLDVREFFKKIRVGIKVIDEAHKFFENSLMIDFFSNVQRNYYLTATFTRGDNKEIPIFNKAYSMMQRFGEKTFNYEEKRKHIVLIVIYYNSHPQFVNVSSSYGFSNYKFIDYAMNDENHTMKKVLCRIIKQTENLEGKTLIISPKVDSVKYLANIAKDETDKSVGIVYASQGEEKNKKSLESTIISSTIKSIGEGDNIKGLRILINFDPIGSKPLADQLRGRLREYSKDDDTFMFYPIDMGFKEPYEMFKRVLPVMKKKCKEIIFVKWNDI